MSQLSANTFVDVAPPNHASPAQNKAAARATNAPKEAPQPVSFKEILQRIGSHAKSKQNERIEQLTTDVSKEKPAKTLSVNLKDLQVDEEGKLTLSVAALQAIQQNQDKNSDEESPLSLVLSLDEKNQKLVAQLVNQSGEAIKAPNGKWIKANQTISLTINSDHHMIDEGQNASAHVNKLIMQLRESLDRSAKETPETPETGKENKAKPHAQSMPIDNLRQRFYLEGNGNSQLAQTDGAEISLKDKLQQIMSQEPVSKTALEGNDKQQSETKPDKTAASENLAGAIAMNLTRSENGQAQKSSQNSEPKPAHPKAAVLSKMVSESQVNPTSTQASGVAKPAGNTTDSNAESPRPMQLSEGKTIQIKQAGEESKNASDKPNANQSGNNSSTKGEATEAPAKKTIRLNAAQTKSANETDAPTTLIKTAPKAEANGKIDAAIKQPQEPKETLREKYGLEIKTINESKSSAKDQSASSKNSNDNSNQQADRQVLKNLLQTPAGKSARESNQFMQLVQNANAQGESQPVQSHQHAAHTQTTSQLDSASLSTQTQKAAEAQSTSTQERVIRVQEAMSQQIVNGVKGAISSDRSYVNLRLHPESLGRVVVELSLDKGALTAHITSQKDSTRALIEQNINHLRTAFEDSSIRVERLVINKESLENRSNNDAQNRQSSSDRHSRSDQEQSGRNQQQGNGRQHQQGSYSSWVEQWINRFYGT